jgi:hypothetical protein
MTAIAVPAAINYPNPLVSLSSKQGNQPPETNRYIPCSIQWGNGPYGGATLNDGGPNNCVNVFPQNLSPQAFSQIIALNVDNTKCGADVVFTFPDTYQTLTVPAYEEGVFPVFTGSLQFYVQAINGYQSDQTNFSILNFLPPPVAVGRSSLSTKAVSAQINLAVNGSTTILPASFYGTVKSFNVFASFGSAGSAGCNFNLTDGGGGHIGQWQFNLPAAGGDFIGVLADISDIDFRVYNGLSGVVTGFTGSIIGAASVNIFYRTP